MRTPCFGQAALTTCCARCNVKQQQKPCALERSSARLGARPASEQRNHAQTLAAAPAPRHRTHTSEQARRSQRRVLPWFAEHQLRHGVVRPSCSTRRGHDTEVVQTSSLKLIRRQPRIHSDQGIVLPERVQRGCQGVPCGRNTEAAPAQPPARRATRCRKRTSSSESPAHHQPSRKNLGGHPGHQKRASHTAFWWSCWRNRPATKASKDSRP